jgi:hypothetical protein
VLNLSIYPGQQVHQQYTGAGKDCPGGSYVRPGTMDGIGSENGGLPGLNQAGGGSQLGSGGPAIVQGVSVADGSVYSPASGFQGARELAPTPPLYHGGRRKSQGRRRLSKKQKKLLRKQQQQQQQSGGRYGAFPELGPLNATNGVGTIGSPFLRVGCEAGTTNALNANPGGVQSMTTAVTASPPGWTPFAMKGGRRRRTQKKKGRRSRGQMGGASLAGGVSVGEMDSMRYYAPTAGYSNWPMTPAVGNNPGILMQTGYPAGHFNQACMKTN